MKKNILIAVACILAVLIVFSNIYLTKEATEVIETVQNIVMNEIDNIEAQEENTVEATEKNQSTTEIPDLSTEEEQQLEEQNVESEGFELQGNIAYEGDSKNWNITTGNTPQLTYISQVDKRWKDYPYTAIGDSSQTIGSSGCGVASAAMIIDSIVGYVDITDLAYAFVGNGYRSPNSATYWSAFRAIADEFDIEYQETSNLNTAVEKLKNNNYVVASVGNGLFTYGGHFIVLVGVENNTIKIYDPYLYNRKFDTSTRRGKVTVSGNTVYCSIENFEKYANYKGFFCYGYEPEKVITENKTDNSVVTETNINNTVGNTYKLSKATQLYKEASMNTAYNYKKGTSVTVLENVTSKIDKVRINKTGLIRYVYNSDYINSNTSTNNSNSSFSSNSNTIEGKTYTLSKYTKLYADFNMSKGYNYLKGTKVVILENVSSEVARVKVVKTGLIRYVNIKYLK